MVAVLAALHVLAPPAGHVLSTQLPGDGLVVPNSSSLHLFQDLTVEAWIRPEKTPVARQYQFIVSKNYEGTGFALLLTGFWEDARVQFEANDTIAHKIPLNVMQNHWWHVAGVFRGGESIALYLNGVLVASKPTTHRLVPNDMPLCIGTSPWEGFKGQIDNVRIWNEVRSQKQILEGMSQAVTSKQRALVAEWDFERYGKGLVWDRAKNTVPGKLQGKARVLRR